MFRFLKVFFIFSILLSSSLMAQEFTFNMSREDDTLQAPDEIGIDGHFYGTNFGGSFGLGLKYGLVRKQDPQFIFGPSFRVQRVWSTFIDNVNGFTIFGLGAFTHARFYEVLFLGAEFEVLNSPIQYNLVNPQKRWTPTLFLGGGYSHKFDAGWRLNIALYYDILNQPNSPFRESYIAKSEVNGEIKLLPVIYRVALFFPLR